MAKATRKNTTPAERATPDSIIKLIDEADGALDEYRAAETAVKAANARQTAAYEVLARITKDVAQKTPTTAAGALALIEYAGDRSAPSVRAINCIHNDANLYQLLWRAREVLKAA